MAITPLSKAVADYIKAFDLVALVVWRDGRIGATRDPAGAARAWWCQAASVGMVVKAARRNGADIETAARSTGGEIVGHAVVLARAEAAIAKINSGMQWAQRAGDSRNSTPNTNAGGSKPPSKAGVSCRIEGRRRVCGVSWRGSQRPGLRRRRS
jgi:hypothetical protein